MRLVPGGLTLAELPAFEGSGEGVELDPSCRAALAAGAEAVAALVAKGEPVYGINTGFGPLAREHIPTGQLELLQRNLVLSHSVGIGPALPDAVVRLAMLLKVASLARGYSGVRPVLVDALLALLNARVYPCIPSKGSVGASGDLAPLAHMAAPLLGWGAARHDGRRVAAAEALRIAGLETLPPPPPSRARRPRQGDSTETPSSAWLSQRARCAAATSRSESSNTPNAASRSKSMRET